MELQNYTIVKELPEDIQIISLTLDMELNERENKHWWGLVIKEYPAITLHKWHECRLKKQKTLQKKKSLEINFKHSDSFSLTSCF